MFTVELASEADIMRLEQMRNQIVERHGREVKMKVQGNYHAFIRNLDHCDGLTSGCMISVWCVFPQ